MRTLAIKSNKAKRTFTIRVSENDKLVSKYRTIQFSKEEFESAEYWTENDWFQFLKTDEYYTV